MNPETDADEAPLGTTDLRSFFASESLGQTPAQTPFTQTPAESSEELNAIRMRTAALNKLVDSEYDSSAEFDLSQTYSMEMELNRQQEVEDKKQRKRMSQSYDIEAARKKKVTIAENENKNKKPKNTIAGMLDLDMMKSLFSQSLDTRVLTTSNNDDDNRNPRAPPKLTRGKAKMLKQRRNRALSNVMRDDSALNSILVEAEEYKRALLTADPSALDDDRPQSEPNIQGTNKKRAEKLQQNDQPQKKKRRKQHKKQKQLAKFQNSLQAPPHYVNNSQISAPSNHIPSVNSVVNRNKTMPLKEFQLIEMRFAEVLKSTSEMPSLLNDAFNSYDPENKDTISVEQALMTLESNDIFLSHEDMDHCIRTSLDSNDPSLIRYRKLCAKVIKRLRFDFTCQQLGSAIARRNANILDDLPPNPDDENDDINNYNEFANPNQQFMDNFNGTNVPSSKANLPPLKLKEIIAKRHLKRDGNFDNNFARETPHILKGQSSNNGNNQAMISELRRELQYAEQGLTMLNEEVKKGVQWVQLNCPAPNKNNRAKKYCKQWGVEKLKHFLAGHDMHSLSHAFYKWLDLRQYITNQKNVQNYIKIKTSHKIYSMLFTFCSRQLANGFNHWLNNVISDRNAEFNRCSIQIERIVRGFLDRRWTMVLRREASAKKIQGCFRMRKSRKLANAMKEKKQMHDAAAFLQRRYRDYQSRKMARTIVHAKKMERGARMIQNRWRTRNSMMRVTEMREAKAQRESATLLQRRFRGFEARRDVAKMKREREMNAAANTIQRRYRGVQGQLKYAMKKLEKDSSNKIANCWRVYKAKQTTAGKMQAFLKKKQMEEEDRAARIMQGRVRMYGSKKVVNARREEKRRRLEAEEQDAAARLMQGKVRGYAARKRVNAMRQDKREIEEQDDAATKMQNKFRGFQARKTVKQKREQNKFMETERKKRWQAENDENIRAELEEQDRAARLMQGKARMYGARRKTNKLRARKQKEIEDAEMDNAARILQGRAKGFNAKRELKLRKKNKKDRENWAATKIQVHYRGRQGRVKFQNRYRQNQERLEKIKEQERLLEEEEMNAAATKIQGVFRARRARRKMEAKRSELAKLEAAAEEKRIIAEHNAAAQRISNVMRAFVAVRKVLKRKAENKKRLAELEAAGDASAKEIEEMKRKMQAEIQAMEMSASLQAAQDKKDLERAQKEHAEALAIEQELEAQQEEVEKERCALKIQEVWRKRQDRRRRAKARADKIALKEKMRQEKIRQELEEKLRKEKEAEERKAQLELDKKRHRGATKIQGLYRTKLARRKLRKKKEMKLKEAERKQKDADKFAEKLKAKETEVAKMKSGPGKKKALEELKKMQAEGEEKQAKANKAKEEAIMGGMAEEMALNAEAKRKEEEAEAQIVEMELKGRQEESAIMIQNCYRCRQARREIHERREIGLMRERKSELVYEPPPKGKELGTFIKPGAFARLEKYGGDLRDYGDDMEAFLDAQAAEFVKRENGKAAKERAERMKVEKEKALAERAIVMRETALVLGDGFDVPDMTKVKKELEEAKAEGKRMAEEAARIAREESEERIRQLEERMEARLRIIEDKERDLAAREQGINVMARDAETQKLLSLHAQANADAASRELMLAKEKEDIDRQRRELLEPNRRGSGAGDAAAGIMVSSGGPNTMSSGGPRSPVGPPPPRGGGGNGERAITPAKNSDWVEYYDDQAKSSYWFNTATNEASWVKPDDMVGGGGRGGGGARRGKNTQSSTGDVSDYDTDNGETAGFGTGGSASTGGAGQWQELFDESANAKYYYNPETGEARWDDPNGGGGGGGGGGGAGSDEKNWSSFIDPETGSEYKVHNITGETRWDL